MSDPQFWQKTRCLCATRRAHDTL